VEVDPGLLEARPGLCLPRQEIRQVQEALRPAAPDPGEGLVQIAGLLEAGEEPSTDPVQPRRLDAQRAGELHLADADARVRQTAEGLLRLLELDRLVAGVEANAEMAAQDRIGGAGR
jgi:hypothetical protein